MTEHDFDEEFNLFWIKHVWKTNYNNIYHKKIFKIIHDFQKLLKQPIFNIDHHNNLSVIDKTKFIHDNILFLKTHAECFI